MKLSDRIAQLKASRPVSYWERQVGIARGNLDRALKDDKLSDENIRKLCKWENARADWLLLGSGAPYQTATFNTDHDLSDQLNAYLIDEAESRTLTVVTRKSDDLPCAVVLTMPGQYQAGKAMVDYTILDVLVGPIGLYSRGTIKDGSWRKRQQVTLDDEVVESLCKGGIGTYALMLDPGYLKAAGPLDDQTLADVAEESAGYTVPLTPPEQRLLTTYRALPNDDRHRLLAIADTLKSCAG